MEVDHRQGLKKKTGNNSADSKALFDIFLALYPVGNNDVRRKAQKVRDVSQAEYWVFNGLMILCALTKTGGVEGLYKNEEDGIIGCVNAEEHMNKKRLKEIKSVWIEQFASPQLKECQPWWQVSRLVHGFNLNRSKTVAASRVKTLDESMSSYKPQKSKTGNLPNISYIAR